MYRLSRLAGFVKNNMPFGTTHKNPKLSNEEAWDVAAYINSQPRSVKLFAYDWPNIGKKPVDHPFGPYTDTFSEIQHKYGPFGPIKASKEKSK
jgi:thiosulfate dehydrogenase